MSIPGDNTASRVPSRGQHEGGTPEVLDNMEVPLIAGVGQDMWPSRYPARVAALQSHRRGQRLRTWGTGLSVFIACVWLALVVVGGLGH